MRFSTLLVAYAALVLAIISLTPQPTSPHSSARAGTIDSLVERGSFALDGSPFADTVDKVYIDGKFYAHQPPAMAVLGAAVYYPLHLLGLRFGPAYPATYILLTFILNGLTSVIGLYFFHQALQWTGLNPNLHIPLTASLAFATLILTFSTTLNSHAFCAALISIGLYYFLLSRRSGHPNRALFWSGIAFALCAASDHMMVVFYLLFAGVDLLQSRRISRVFFLFLPAVFVLVPEMAYYYTIGHSFKPFAARPELFMYPGSQWSVSGPAETRLTGGSWNSLPFALHYGTLMLIGPRRGFLIYNPLAGLAIYGMLRAVWTRAQYRMESIAVLGGSAAIIVYYALTSANYSGASYSIRWFVPFLPLWWFFGIPAIANAGAWGAWRKSVLAAVGVLALVYAFAGALNPWPYEWRGALVPLSNIRETLSDHGLKF